jgi:hypothetical protein
MSGRHDLEGGVIVMGHSFETLEATPKLLEALRNPSKLLRTPLRPRDSPDNASHR